MKSIAIPFVVIVLCGAMALAQSGREPKQVELAVHPQAISESAAGDRFLPELSERTPGNGANLYLISFLVSAHIAQDPDMDAMIEASPAQLPVDKAKQLVAQYGPAIDRIEAAGRRAYCDFEPAYREQGFEALLPYLNSARQMANVLAIDAKLAIRERHFDRALRDLRIGFTLVNDLDQDPVAVQSLVAVGIESLMLNVVEAFVQEPGSPNLYWPLANLPSAGQQRVRTMQLERSLLFYQYPGLRHPEQMSAEESRRVLETLGRATNKSNTANLGLAMIVVVRRYPEAKKFLVSRGMDPHEVESLAANSVVLAYDLDELTRREDSIEKWLGLPLWQAYAGVGSELQSVRQENEAMNPFMLVLPAMDRVLLQYIRVDRKRDMLLIVEAARAYAASHGGSFPGSLEDLSPQTPVRPDALTGHRFEYNVSDGVVTLRGPTTPEPARDEFLRIKLAQ